MIDFTLYSSDNAPPASRPGLNGAQEKFSFVPNVLRQMAESPAALGANLQLMGQLEQSSLTPAEQWTALLVVAYENTSDYCVAANSTVAQMMGVPSEIIEGVRSGEPLADPRFEALRRFTAALVRNRGSVGDDATREFLDAGFTKAHVLEVILAVALETMASYTGRTLSTPVDEQFQGHAWTPPVTAGASLRP